MLRGVIDWQSARLRGDLRYGFNVHRQSGAEDVGTAPIGMEIRHDIACVPLRCMGSISDVQVSQFTGEVADIARRTRAQVHVLWCDEVVYEHAVLKDVSNAAPGAAVRVRRDGGADFEDVRVLNR